MSRSSKGEGAEQKAEAKRGPGERVFKCTSLVSATSNLYLCVCMTESIYTIATFTMHSYLSDLVCVGL